MPTSVWAGHPWMSTAKPELVLSVISTSAVIPKPQVSHLSHGNMVVSSAGGLCVCCLAKTEPPFILVVVSRPCP